MGEGDNGNGDGDAIKRIAECAADEVIGRRLRGGVQRGNQSPLRRCRCHWAAAVPVPSTAVRLPVKRGRFNPEKAGHILPRRSLHGQVDADILHGVGPAVAQLQRRVERVARQHRLLVNLQNDVGASAAAAEFLFRGLDRGEESGDRIGIAGGLRHLVFLFNLGSQGAQGPQVNEIGVAARGNICEVIDSGPPVVDGQIPAIQRRLDLRAAHRIRPRQTQQVGFLIRGNERCPQGCRFEWPPHRR